MPRVQLWALASLAAAAAVAALSSTAAGDGWPCGVVGARLLDESRRAQVAKLRVRDGAVKARYFGCLRSTGRPVLVGENIVPRTGDEYYVDEDFFRLRGRFVAVAPYGCLAECSPPSLEVFDLASGERTRAIYPKGSYGELLRVMLTSRGALAYVTFGLIGNRRGLGKADALGHDLLARGSPARMPPSSIKLRRHRLLWVFDGEQRSLRLR